MADEELNFITPEIEKRRYRRAALVTEVKCVSSGHAAVLVTRDVSAGGVFITTRDPFPEGSPVQLSLRLESGQPALGCSGKVVHSLAGIGMGIEFENLSDGPRQRLQKFVDEVR